MKKKSTINNNKLFQLGYIGHSKEILDDILRATSKSHIKLQIKEIEIEVDSKSCQINNGYENSNLSRYR